MHSCSKSVSVRFENRRPCAAFSLIELLVVLVVIGILTVLVSSGVQYARTMAKRATCVGNLRAIGHGFNLYLADNNNVYFGAGPGANASGATYEARGYYRWPQRLGPYMDLQGEILTLQTTDGDSVRVLANAYRHAVFHSPFTDERHWRQGNGIGLNSTMGVYGINTKIAVGSASNGLNIYGINAAQITNPSRTILMGEHFAGDAYDGKSAATAGVELHRDGPYPIKTNGLASNSLTGINHKGPTNILFADGHVETISIADLLPWPDSAQSRGRMTFLP